MRSGYLPTFATFALALLLSGCDDSQWIGASSFEASITCQSSLDEVNELVSSNEMKVVGYHPIAIEKEGKLITSTTAILVRKENTAYSLIFRDAGLESVTKQGFTKLGVGKGFRFNSSVEQLLSCQ